MFRWRVLKEDAVIIDWKTYLSDENMLVREDRRDDPSAWQASSREGAIATAHYRATRAGAEILEKGGNAVDAAVAVSLALGVVEPAASGLGGMTMMMIHLSRTNRTFALSGPCRAPYSVFPENLVSSSRRRGYKAVAVPSNPAVLEYALKHYGTFSTKQVIDPAIRLAEKGFPLTNLQYRIMQDHRDKLLKYRKSPIIFDKEIDSYKPLARIRRPKLAQTLARLAEDGFLDFYKGKTARIIAADMAKNGGLITEEDLQDIPWPVEQEPLIGNIEGWKIFTLAPPGGGTALIEMLNLFGELETSGFESDSPQAAVLFAAIIRQARTDRRNAAKKISDKMDTSSPKLTDKKYAERTAPKLRRFIDQPGETSHFCIMDRFGNVVSQTQSIERSFGSMMMTESLGFFYNGYMKTFKLKNKSHPFYLRPGASARSNAAPTIVFRDDTPFAAIGSTGSERMSSGIFQVLARLRKQTPFVAVRSPRLHCTPEGVVWLEMDRFSKEAVRELVKRGFAIEQFDSWSFKTGGLQLCTCRNGVFSGVADPRRDGAAAGPEQDI